jgi:cytochrome b pre-mRNA-processing protein 3
MLRFLFPRLTPTEPRGAALFAELVVAARQPHWYRDGGVPDSIDGRFAVLASLVALATVRLERSAASGAAATVAIAERFVEAMDAEHRQLGLNDPKLGRTVRKLLGSVAKRVDQWRAVTAQGGDWRAAASASLALSDAPDAAIDHSERALREFWGRLDAASDAAVADGAIA